MVELVDRDQRVVEQRLVDGVVREPQCRVRADQHGVLALEEPLDLGDLALIRPWRAEVVAVVDAPVGEEAMLRQWCARKRRADRALRDRDDDLLESLVVELVEGEEHQCARLTGRGWCLDQQVSACPRFEGLGLHLAHAHVGDREALAGVLVLDVDQIRH